jgi:hypothetical protein
VTRLLLKALVGIFYMTSCIRILNPDTRKSKVIGCVIFLIIRPLPLHLLNFSRLRPVAGIGGLHFFENILKIEIFFFFFNVTFYLTKCSPHSGFLSRLISARNLYLPGVEHFQHVCSDVLSGWQLYCKPYHLTCCSGEHLMNIPYS